jgi:hypothetical protein
MLLLHNRSLIPDYQTHKTNWPEFMTQLVVIADWPDNTLVLKYFSEHPATNPN